MRYIKFIWLVGCAGEFQPQAGAKTEIAYEYQGVEVSNQELKRLDDAAWRGLQGKQPETETVVVEIRPRFW